MSRSLLLSLVLLGLVLSASAAVPSKTSKFSPRQHPAIRTFFPAASENDGPNPAALSKNLCPLCVNVMSQGISQLLNIIMNSGVIGGCNSLCSKLSDKGQLFVTGCNLVCDIVGVKAFVSLIKKADLDPVWICQEFKTCAVQDCEAEECGRMNAVVVQPEAGPIGTTFTATAQFDVLNKTGTGMFVVNVDTPSGDSLGTSQLMADGWDAQSYKVNIDIPIVNDPDAESQFEAGQYTVTFTVCQGSCGSSHKHARVLASGSSSFKVTDEQTAKKSPVLWV